MLKQQPMAKVRGALNSGLLAFAWMVLPFALVPSARAEWAIDRNYAEAVLGEMRAGKNSFAQFYFQLHQEGMESEFQAGHYENYYDYKIELPHLADASLVSASFLNAAARAWIVRHLRRAEEIAWELQSLKLGEFGVRHAKNGDAAARTALLERELEHRILGFLLYLEEMRTPPRTLKGFLKGARPHPHQGAEEPLLRAAEESERAGNSRALVRVLELRNAVRLPIALQDKIEKLRTGVLFGCDDLMSAGGSR